MGILGRFKDIMASNINAIFNKEGNPEKEIAKYLDQMRSDLGQVNAETAAMEIEYSRAKRAYAENQQEIDKYKRYAEKAAEQGNVADQNLYLQKAEDAERDGAAAKQRYEELKENSEKLSAMRDKLSTDISTLEAKASELKAKMNEAKAKGDMNKIAQKVGNANTDEMFAKMNEKAERAMDLANAEAELQSSGHDEIDDLINKYDN